MTQIQLLVKLLNNDIVCEDLFQQYRLALTSLAENIPIAPLLRKFELSLLSELGLSLDFTPILDDISDKVAGFYYIPEQGFVPAYKYSINHISTPWFNIEHLQIIVEHIYHDKVIINKAAEHTFKLLMRNIFHHLLDGKPLNSRKLFEKSSG